MTVLNYEFSTFHFKFFASMLKCNRIWAVVRWKLVGKSTEKKNC